MAVKNEKSYRSFIKGYVTEAGALTFPENASLDEDNFVLNRDGSRSRRLGIDFEDLFDLIDSEATADQISKSKISFYKWDTPAGDSTISIGVVRVYNKLFFLNLITANPSANLINNSEPLEIEGLGNAPIQAANLNNQLVIVSNDLEKPYVLSYNNETQTIDTDILELKVRDIWGVDDGLKVNERPTSKSYTDWKGSGRLTIWNYYSYNNLIYQVVGFGDSIDNYTTRTRTYTVQLGFASTGKSIPTGTVIGGLEAKENVIWKHIGNSDSPSLGLSDTHKYNLRNQGWHKSIQVYSGQSEKDAILLTGKLRGWYPSNADNWTLGKNSNPTSSNYERFSTDILQRNSHSNYQVAKGSFVIDAFNRGTSRVEEVDDSGARSLPLDRELGRITTVASYAQRLFYSGISSNIIEADKRSPNYNNYIFFTKIVKSTEDLSKCYQEADPTDPGINSVIASDGGTIQIPEASKIIKLVPTQSSLLVFAENGIWEVFGDTGGFYATTFQISKITSNGTLNQDSIVEANGSFLYWSNSGIYALSAERGPGTFRADNISLPTIQSYFLDIPSLAKLFCKGFYDERENRVRWLYNDLPAYGDTITLNEYNKELVYDLTLEAFYKNSFSSLDSDSPYVTDYVALPNFVVSSEVTDIVVGANQVVVTVDSVETQVVVNTNTTEGRSTSFSFLTFKGTDFTLSKYKNTSFVDWQVSDGIGKSYSSYLVTGYEVFNDIMKDKQVPYVFFYFNKTEDGFSNVDGNILLDNPSSCLVQAQWNWTDSINSGRWGPQFQAYRFKRNYIPSGAADTFDTGEAVVVTRNKLRGKGKALSLRIESEEGKDLQILGWSMPVTMTSIA